MPRLFLNDADCFSFTLGVREGSQVEYPDGEFPVVIDRRDGIAIYRTKTGTQDFVASHYAAKGLFECFDIKRSSHLHDVRDVVRGRPRRELIEKPHLLLTEGEPCRFGWSPARDGRRTPAQTVGP